MLELQGKNGLATVFTDNVDEKTIGQIIGMLNEPITENAVVRIMPDTHYGKGATIGTSIKLPENRDEWKVAPSIVGVDLSCAMMTMKIKSGTEIDLEKLDQVVNSVVPAGATLHARGQKNKVVKQLVNELSFDIQDLNKHYKGLGTLGGGNHFIELAVDEQGDHWLTVHSGSRGFGAKIARHHEKIAERYNVDYKDEIDQAILELTQAGRQSEIQSTLLAMKDQHRKQRSLIPYLEGKLLQDYLNDISVADKYAHESRRLMLQNIVDEMGWEVVDEFDSVHNNIDIENGIIRKGATSARKGERLIIPLNMRDGSLICVGKGNDEWNQSAPHGAGRMLSRSQARQLIDLDEYREQMKDVYTSSVGLTTLDEAPDCYKPADEIKAAITDTAEIIHHLKPVYNFKAH